MFVTPMAEKREHHNELERRRRDHIKDSFSNLRESVPALKDEKVASRAVILKKAADYIRAMKKRHNAHQQNIDDLKRQNKLLEFEILKLEKAAKSSGGFVDSSPLPSFPTQEFEYDTSGSESSRKHKRSKKHKIKDEYM